jgi:hypothetical protein
MVVLYLSSGGDENTEQENGAKKLTYFESLREWTIDLSRIYTWTCNFDFYRQVGSFRDLHHDDDHVCTSSKLKRFYILVGSCSMTA